MGEPEPKPEIELFWTLWNRKDKAGLTRLIDSGFSLNQELEDPDNHDYAATPLVFAIERGDIEFVEFFLDMGADPIYIPNGVSPIFAIKEFDDTDIEILQLLLEKGALLLPHYPRGYTIIDHLLWKREEFLRLKTKAIEENGDYTLAHQYARSIKILRRQLEVLQAWSPFIKTLRIETLDGGVLGEISIDARATVGLLKLFIVNFIFERRITVDDFDLVMPSFRHPNDESKKKMEDERDLTDYNIQDNTRLVVVPRLVSGFKGGKRMTRRQASKRLRKTRRSRKH